MAMTAVDGRAWKDLARPTTTRDYVGIRSHDGLDGTTLSVQRNVVAGNGSARRLALPHVGNHSPTGFGWGYAGSGPADLALSILADATGGNKRLAWVLHQRYKSQVIARFSQQHGWHLTVEEVLEWVRHALTDETLAQYEAIKYKALRRIF